ncbi:unnamed protein product [Gordionus sp. m RMFG-2023]
MLYDYMQTNKLFGMFFQKYLKVVSQQKLRKLSTYVLDNLIPKNEPILNYEHGSWESEKLLKALSVYKDQVFDIPIIIGDQEYRTDDIKYQLIPYNHKHKLAKFYYASPELIKKAINVSLNAQEEWDNQPYEKRAQIFLKAADLVSNRERMNLMAATMIGQAKTVVQAEIDTACELADFLRFNAYFGKKLQEYTPYSPPETRNSYRFRALEGFIAAISPFNFTAIGGNLASSTALMGNVVLWKPSDTAILSNYLTYKIFRECGLPSGVINFLPCDGPVFSSVITKSPSLAGINFTGSVATFRSIWLSISQNLISIGNWPRLVGECGGKNYHLVHASANMDHVINSTVRAAFEYGGQKCSACSILYIPKSKWNSYVKPKLMAAIQDIKIGDATDKNMFYSAVIDKKAFDKISGYIDFARNSSEYTIVSGGKCDDSKGYFIEPTMIETKNPKGKLMVEVHI